MKKLKVFKLLMFLTAGCSFAAEEEAAAVGGPPRPRALDLTAFGPAVVSPEESLMMAINSGRLEICGQLLDAGGINLNIHEGHGFLHAAARSGRRDICELLLDRGARMDLPADRDPSRPLHYAALFGHEDICSLFIERGCDPDIEAVVRYNHETGEVTTYTPLYHAAEAGNLAAMRVLLEAGALISPEIRGVATREALYLLDSQGLPPKAAGKTE